MRPKAVIFDAYGTLLDVNAAARGVAQSGRDLLFAQNWSAVAQIWRTKQLEYSWLRTIADHHADFWQITQDSLTYALEYYDLPTAGETAQALLDLYWNLDAYEDAAPALQAARSLGLPTGILSNGTHDMLNAAAQSGGLTAHLDVILSIDDVGRYKPCDQVYSMVTEQFSIAPQEVLFVSSNGWDIAGASGFGFRTIWVNRAGLPQDRLFAAPHRIAPSLIDFERYLHDI